MRVGAVLERVGADVGRLGGTSCGVGRQRMGLDLGEIVGGIAGETVETAGEVGSRTGVWSTLREEIFNKLDSGAAGDRRPGPRRPSIN